MASLDQLNERAIALPIIGFLLLTSPLLLLFNIPEAFFGIPVLYLYTFSIWVLLLVAGWALSRRLPNVRQPRDKGADQQTDQPRGRRHTDKVGDI